MFHNCVGVSSKIHGITCDDFSVHHCRVYKSSNCTASLAIGIYRYVSFLVWPSHQLTRRTKGHGGKEQNLIMILRTKCHRPKPQSKKMLHNPTTQNTKVSQLYQSVISRESRVDRIQILQWDIGLLPVTSSLKRLMSEQFFQWAYCKKGTYYQQVLCITRLDFS